MLALLSQNAESWHIVKVLVADDNGSVAKTVAAILEHHGCQVATAENGVAAFRRCRLSPPDVLVTDVDMPEMDGIELAMRVSRLYPSCKIILYSAHAITDTSIACPYAYEGYLPVLAKPVNPSVLVRMVLSSAKAREMGYRAA
jgi:CheY-like chemotaxis protein